MACSEHAKPQALGKSFMFQNDASGSMVDARSAMGAIGAVHGTTLVLAKIVSAAIATRNKLFIMQAPLGEGHASACLSGAFG